MNYSEISNSRAVFQNKALEYERQSMFDITKTFDLLSELFKWLAANMVDSSGKWKFSIWKIVPLYREAKKFAEQIIAIYGTEKLIKRLQFIPMGLSDVLVNYFIWILENIVTPEGKISISVTKIYPFIIRTIGFTKEIIDLFKRKNLI